METIAIIGLTAILGYTFTKQKTQDKIENLDVMPENNKPNSMNIYNSNRVNEIEDGILQKSTELYKKSSFPKLSHVLPPIYNSYSAVGKIDMKDRDISVKQLDKINHTNRFSDPLKKEEPRGNR